MPVRILENLNTLTKLAWNFHSHAAIFISRPLPYRELGMQAEAN